MSPGWVARLCARPGFPRVSGDEPIGGVNLKMLETFSPRERG